MAAEGLNQEFYFLQYSLMKSASVAIRTLNEGMHSLKKDKLLRCRYSIKYGADAIFKSHIS
jgi:hypothetical protein